ncbi:MAG: squalene/phytoene synthase family protein [Elusimicrobia bacterium]|nr:squalene/phytoene synthase family protein [Elusimicrobiota bacterium]
MSAPALAERRSNFFLGFLLLPKEKRQALSAVYSYCRLIDDIVDSGHLRSDEAGRMLDYWQAEVDRLFAGTPTHSVSSRLLPWVSMFRLPREPFLEMIRGCRMDLERRRYETFAQLESYLQGVACSVGALGVGIFGYAHTPKPRMEEFVRLFGYAFQMTNIIRDVGADLEIGRVYIPEEDMRQAGYSPQALINRIHSPAFERLMELEYDRTQTFYRRARNLVDFRDRPSLLPAEVMAHIYEGVLHDIKDTGFRVLFERKRLSRWRKLALAFKAWLYCQGIHL